MKYSNIVKATFLARPNRFEADVDLNGQDERVHVKNTGRCKELLIKGAEVYLTAPGTPGRKTTYDLVAVKKPSTGVLFNIDSQAPNKVVKEWLSTKDYDKVTPEYTYGNSRIDFYMEKETTAGTKRFLMEVKGCTLEIDGTGYFPDAPTERGVKHIRELIKARAEGYESILAFVIQMEGVDRVLPHVATHPEFGEAMEDARRAGVKILFLTTSVTPEELKINGETLE